MPCEVLPDPGPAVADPDLGSEEPKPEPSYRALSSEETQGLLSGCCDQSLSEALGHAQGVLARALRQNLATLPRSTLAAWRAHGVGLDLVNVALTNALQESYAGATAVVRSATAHALLGLVPDILKAPGFRQSLLGCLSDAGVPLDTWLGHNIALHSWRLFWQDARATLLEEAAADAKDRGLLAILDGLHCSEPNLIFSLTVLAHEPIALAESPDWPHRVLAWLACLLDENVAPQLALAGESPLAGFPVITRCVTPPAWRPEPSMQGGPCRELALGLALTLTLLQAPCLLARGGRGVLLPLCRAA